MARGKRSERQPKARSDAGRLTRARRCSLCGKTNRLTTTECCGNVICDDEATYVVFSYARNSCHRNHRRFTLCGYHHAEEHAGAWKECTACRNEFETEMYVYYGTNEYNFEKLANPPSFEPTHCSVCERVINLAEDGFSQRGDDYFCESCTEKEFERRLSTSPELQAGSGRRQGARGPSGPGGARGRQKWRPR